jgi:arylsulfatase A-like enzyme
VVKYPKSFEPTGGEAQKAITHKFATVMDLAPTVLDMAGLKQPAPPTYNNREVVPIRGKSFVPFLKGTQEGVHEKQFIRAGKHAAGQRSAKVTGRPYGSPSPRARKDGSYKI